MMVHASIPPKKHTLEQIATETEEEVDVPEICRTQWLQFLEGSGAGHQRIQCQS